MNQIKSMLAGSELIRVLGVGRVLHHNILQMIGIQGGFHGVWFDLEHVGNSVENLEVACLAAKAHGLDSFCRIAPTDYAIVTRCLEAGASGVMAAQIFSAAQAEEFVTWAKFHPRGARGLNVGGADAGFASMPIAEFCETANRDNFVAIQIETTGALEECEQIAAIDGVDMLFVGPSDLSQSLGVIGDFMNQKCLDAIDRVAAACRNHGKSWGAVSASPEHAAMMVDKGCRMLSPASDVKIVNAGIQSVKNQYKSFFE